MAQHVVTMTGLGKGALNAAAHFHAELAPHLRSVAGEGDVVAIFPPAGHEHEAWRLAAIQEIAREAAPNRVNAVVGSDEAGIARTCEYLAAAPGISGQVLELAPATD